MAIYDGRYILAYWNVYKDNLQFLHCETLYMWGNNDFKNAGRKRCALNRADVDISSLQCKGNC